MSADTEVSGEDAALESPRYLADTSALTHMSFDSVKLRMLPLMGARLVAHCGVVDLEMLFIARNHADLLALREELSDSLHLVSMIQQDFERAADVMALLAEAGKHRAAKMPDLLIAAAAEREGITVLHYDADFDHIASVTGQPMEWVAPRGTLGT